MKRPADVLRVCVDARLSGGVGGIQQSVIGLASGLSKLTDGDEEYLFLTYPDVHEWIVPYVQGPCRLLRGPSLRPRWKQFLVSNAPIVRDTWNKLRPVVVGRRATTLPSSLPSSDGTIERAAVDIVHFITSHGFLTDVPSIYHPWDLQHLHLPQFFSPTERQVRETRYRTLCEQARMVSVASSWGKRDLIHHYGLPEEKVRVVPVAPVLDAYPIPTNDDLRIVRRTYSLPEAFVFYPAHTFAHKNHIALLEALAILRDRHGLKVPLICSGHTYDFFEKIKRRISELRLTHQVRFLGFVSPLELQCLYKMCQGLVFPTKFEGWGNPLMEAFLAGTPVACSNVPPLPEQADNAALIFDPDEPERIADTIRRLWTEEALRSTLVERGKKRVGHFTWERTARIFRAHYRRIADRPLTEEDRALLAAPPLV